MRDAHDTTAFLQVTWQGFGRSVAVAAGALTALTSLLYRVPLLAACTRGALALLAILALTRGTAFALGRLGAAGASVPPDEREGSRS